MADTMSTNPCRICMGSKMNQSSIFSNDLSRKVTEIADVEVQEGDGLPPTICKDCELDLEKCYKFREQIQWADSKFRENISATEVVFEECQIKQEVGPMHPFINEEDNQDQIDEDDDDDRGPSDNDEDYEMQEEPEDKTERAEKERNEATHPLDHVEIIEHRTKQEIHMSSTDQNSQDEPLIVTQNMKNENEPTTDPLMHNETQSMETDNSVPGPSTSTPMVKRTLPAASFQNWPDRSDKFVSEQNKETVNLSEPNPLSFCQISMNANVPYLGYLLDDGENANKSSDSRFQGRAEVIANNINQGKSLQPAVNISSPPQNTNLLLLESAPPPPKQDKATSAKINQQLKKPKKKFSVIRVKNLPRETNKSTLGQHFLTEKNSAANVLESPILPNCEICNVDFLSDQLYEDHLKRDEFICRVCTLVMKSHEDLELHFNTHTPYKCKVCKKMFWCYKDLYHHRKTSSTCSSTTVKCDYCYKPFLNKKDLNLHKRKFHSLDEDQAEQQCIICEKKFALRQQLDCHMRNVHVVHEYVECRFCHKFCLGPERLKKHVKFSHVQNKGDELFPCTVCGKVFFNKMCLLSHKNVHDESMSLCELCGRSIKKKSMYDHIRREHDNPGFFKCEPCNKIFNTEKKLRNHLNSSTKHKVTQTAPVYCEICGKPYKTARILAAHLATHSDEKPFKCQICGAAFKQKVTLTTHHRTHTNASKYRCNQCGLSFKWKSTFDNHKKRCNVSQMRESYDYSPSTLMML